MRAPRFVLACCLAAAASVLPAPAGATPPLPGERIAAGVSAAGTPLAGKTVEEAAVALSAVHGARLEQGVITVQAADVTWTLRTADANVLFDALQTAKRALYAGRDAHGAAVDVPLAVTYDKPAVERFAAGIDKRLYRAPRDAKLKISVRRVRVTHAAVGRDIDMGALTQRIAAAIADPRLNRVLKPKLLVVKPRVSAVALRARASTVITIDQRTFTLRLFKRMKVVKRYKVAVGQPAYPTPRGLFSIVSKQVNPVWSVPNSPWAGELAGTTVAGGSASNPLKARWMGIVNGVGIHGTGQEYSIGSRASHGCIRMRVADVIALYPRVPVGTPVLIA